MRSLTIYLSVIFALAASSEVAGQTQIALEAKLISAESVINAGFGSHVDVDGETAVIGVPMERVGGNSHQQGAVYVFVRRKGAWINQARLLAADGYQRQQFGHRVAISGNTIVVGVPLSDINGVKDQGAIYVFERSGDNWEKQVKLLATDGGRAHGLGMAVGISGDTIIAGAPGAYDKPDKNKLPEAIGAAYIFTRNSGNWSEKAKLKEKGDKKGLLFGNQVAIDNNQAVITSATDSLTPDYVNIFSDDGTAWKQEERVPIKGSVDGKELTFGVLKNIALDNNTFIIGGVYAGPKPAAAVHVFVRDRKGWIEQAQLVESELYKTVPFGGNADISGDTILIGSPWNLDLKGAAYVYQRFLDRDKWVWKLQKKLVAADGKLLDVFGAGVAISGKTIVVGASGHDIKKNNWNEGAAYVFGVGDGTTSTVGTEFLLQNTRMTEIISGTKARAER